MVAYIHRLENHKILKTIPNYNREAAVRIFDRLIESFGVIKGINITVSKMQRIPIDRMGVSEVILDELIRRSDEFEEMLHLAGILKPYHGIGAYRWDEHYIYVYVYHAEQSKSRAVVRSLAGTSSRT